MLCVETPSYPLWRTNFRPLSRDAKWDKKNWKEYDAKAQLYVLCLEKDQYAIGRKYAQEREARKLNCNVQEFLKAIKWPH